MSDNSITKFWRELNRRKVIRVTVVYAIVAWVAVEVSSVLFPSLLLPDWTPRLVVALALVGFPVAVGLAWAFQVTPDGMRKEDLQGSPKQTIGGSRLADTPEPIEEERLDGWKRIAAHLNRDVRTVTRWEKNESLPVRRLMHDTQATVYAYRSELDVWMAQRQQVAPAAAPTQKSRERGKSGQRWSWLAAPVLVIGGLLAWYWSASEEPAIAFGEWDWVLITRFDNRTGEELLDGTLEYALQRELANSPFVKVAAESRISDALQLMKLPPDTEIDVKVGREISLRDGGIKMLIKGRIEKLGSHYLLSTELVNPADGVTVASFSSEAIGQDEILTRVGELAGDVRVSLGEGLVSITESQETLATVTTPSLHALRLYTKAIWAMKHSERSQAVPILEEAVRIDPGFASAHLLLVYVLQDRDEMARADQHMKKAVELAESASEQERLFILATYYFYHLEDYPKSIETYQLLVRLYPGHPWANGNLGHIFEWLGRLDQALPFKRRSAEFAPNAAWSHKELVEIAVAVGDLETRDIYLERLVNIPDKANWLETRIRFFPLHENWVNGEYEKLAGQLEDIVSSMDTAAMVADGTFFAHLRSIYLGLGKLERFRELSALRDQLGWFEALLDFDSGNSNTLDKYLETTSPSFWDATLMALAGQSERALEVVTDPATVQTLPPPYQLRSMNNLARGQIALSEGRLEEAINLLGEDNFLLNISNKATHLFAMHSLAQAYEGLGDNQQAIETLEMVRLQKPLMIYEFGGVWMWLRNQVYLRQLYLNTERSREAAETETELREVLRVADADHPFLMALED
jgi:tetratricopeptide (TPR) repeat protein